jgi:hypothetical protein
MEASDLVAQAAEIVDERPDLTHKAFAEEVGISARTWRGWRGDTDSTPSPVKLRSLREWIESQKGGDAYGGPADAERDPQSVAAEDMQEYGTGDYGRPEPPEPDVNGATAGTDFDPEQAIQEQARRFKQKHRRAQKKRRQTIRFDTGPIMIAFVGDQHLGNAGTDVERVFEE